LDRVRFDPDLDRLQRELDGDGYLGLLEDLKEWDRFFEQFSTWREVVSYMWTSVSRDAGKERILRAILDVHALDRRPHWRTILLVFFWPGMRALQRKKQQWTDDPDEFWQDIVSSLLEVVSALYPRTTRMHPVSAIYWGTFHALYRKYAAQWERDRRELQVDSEFIQARILGTRYGRSPQEDLASKLDWHRKSGRINEVEFLLLVGSLVHGRPLKDCAGEIGLTYEAAKKRRQRGLGKLKELGEDFMSPNEP